MPAYYWMMFYLDQNKLGVDDLVRKVTHTLIEGGCRFKHVQIPKVEDYSLPWKKWSYEFEKKTVDLSEAEDLATADLEDRKSGSPHEHRWPLSLRFRFEFEFDDEVQRMIQENPRRDDKEEVNELDLTFSEIEDPVFGSSMSLTITTWEEYVLMYGQEETHRRNKIRILRISEAIYHGINPYFGWMDGEMNSNDESYEPLLRGELPIENEFVFVGSPLIKYLDMKRLKSSKCAWKLLPDGGVLIQNYRRYRDDPSPSLDRII